MIVQALNLQPFKLPNFSWPMPAFFYFETLWILTFSCEAIRLRKRKARFFTVYPR